MNQVKKIPALAKILLHMRSLNTAVQHQDKDELTSEQAELFLFILQRTQRLCAHVDMEIVRNIDLFVMKMRRAKNFSSTAESSDSRNSDEGTDFIKEFSKHYDTIMRVLANIGVNESTARNVKRIYATLTHFIVETETLESFFSQHYGRVYRMPFDSGIVLHTDTHARAHPKKFIAALHLMANNLIGGYYWAEKLGLAKTYFDKLNSGGYCFEGRTRTCMEWLCSKHEEMPLGDVVSDVLKTYRLYIEHLKGIRQEFVAVEGDKLYAVFESFTLLKEFVDTYYTDLRCKPDKTYAPTGRISFKILCRFLSEVSDWKYKEDENENGNEDAMAAARQHHKAMSASRASGKVDS